MWNLTSLILILCYYSFTVSLQFTKNFPGNSSIIFSYINSTHMGIQAKVAMNSYLGVGFGNTMKGSDILLFQAFEIDPVMDNYYAPEKKKPSR